MSPPSPARRPSVRLVLELLEGRDVPSAVGAGSWESLKSAVPGLSPVLAGLAVPGLGRPAAGDVTWDVLAFDAAGRVGVRVTARDVDRVIPPLTELGLDLVGAHPGYHFLEGYLPVGSLVAAAGLADLGLSGVSPIYRPVTAAGAVSNQADFPLQTARVRASPGGLTGAGVTIGVISDSYNALGGEAAGVASGDLPAGLVFRRDLPPGQGTDEGRAMVELIHDLAPGSPKGFATAGQSETEFARNIRALARPVPQGGAGAAVIVDDVTFASEPFFQDGIVAQAVDEVAGRGVAYFSSAGNLADSAYESTRINFPTATVPAIGTGSFYDFDPGSGVDVRQRLTVPAGGLVRLALQWDQPFYTSSGVTTDLDAFLLDARTGAVVAASAEDNPNRTLAPFEFLVFGNNTGATQFDLVIGRFSGPAVRRVKYVDFGQASAAGEWATDSPTISPHAGAAGAMAVAAAPYFDQRTPEGFSSHGPFTVLFSPAGARLSSARVRAKPDIMATDETDTTFFPAGRDIDGNGRPNFPGTSAAAPHAAAVAALVLQANPGLEPDELYDLLRDTAAPVAAPEEVAGAGLVDAYTAVFGRPAPAALNTADGFEAGALDGRWEVFAAGAGGAVVTPTGGPAAGAAHLVLGSMVSGAGSLAEAVLLVDAAGRRGVTLTFGYKDFGPDPQPMPATFTGHGLFDGVALSADGVTWHRLVSLTGAAVGPAYRAFAVDLTAAAAALGLTLGPRTRVKFQQFDPGVGSAGAFDAVLVTALSELAPTAPVTVDGGTPQRSRVRSLTVEFVGRVAAAGAGAFALVRADGLAVPVAVAAVTPLAGGRTRVTLTFTGPALEFGSLPDGRYTLTIDGSKVTDDAGAAVDADGDGVAGGTRAVAFHRLFGDANGDRVVDFRDYQAFDLAFGLAAGDAGFVPGLDYNGDGVIDFRDYQAFDGNFGAEV